MCKNYIRENGRSWKVEEESRAEIRNEEVMKKERLRRGEKKKGRTQRKTSAKKNHRDMFAAAREGKV